MTATKIKMTENKSWQKCCHSNWLGFIHDCEFTVFSDMNVYTEAALFAGSQTVLQGFGTKLINQPIYIAMIWKREF